MIVRLLSDLVGDLLFKFKGFLSPKEGAVNKSLCMSPKAFLKSSTPNNNDQESFYFRS